MFVVRLCRGGPRRSCFGNRRYIWHGWVSGPGWTHHTNADKGMSAQRLVREALEARLQLPEARRTKEAASDG